MYTIDETEIEDFNQIIEKHGHSKDDFELSEVDLTDFSKSNPAFIHGEVTVINKKTGRKKTYKSGHGSVWLGDFENDLVSGNL